MFHLSLNPCVNSKQLSEVKLLVNFWRSKAGFPSFSNKRSTLDGSEIWRRTWDIGNPPKSGGQTTSL